MSLNPEFLSSHGSGELSRDDPIHWSKVCCLKRGDGAIYCHRDRTEETERLTPDRWEWKQTLWFGTETEERLTEHNGTQQKQKEKHSKKTRSLKLEGTSENKPPLKKLIFIIDFCWMDSYCSASNSTNDWWEKTTTCTCPVCKSLSEMHGHLWYIGTAVTFKENERTKASWVYVLFLPARQQKFA